MLRLLPLLLLSGCAMIPASVQYASTAASLGIWAVTGKTTTDHMLSYANDQDCELFRALNDDDVCIDYEDEDE